MSGSKSTIASEEWDFRGTTGKELATVLSYEIARTRDEDRNAILQWQESPFRGFRDAVLDRLALAPAKARQSGVRVREVLQALGDLPEETSKIIRGELGREVPSAFGSKMKQIALYFDRFPTAWMA